MKAKKDIDTTIGGEESEQIALLTAKNAVLESAIAEKDKTITELNAQIAQLKAADKSSVSVANKTVQAVVPTQIVEIRGEKYKAKRAALWHKLRKIMLAEVIEDADLMAELIAEYPSEFELVN